MTREEIESKYHYWIKNIAEQKFRETQKWRESELMAFAEWLINESTQPTQSAEEILRLHCNTEFSTITGVEFVKASIGTVLRAMEEYANQQKEDKVSKFCEQMGITEDDLINGYKGFIDTAIEQVQQKEVSDIRDTIEDLYKRGFFNEYAYENLTKKATSQPRKCEDCGQPLPKGMKHRCYECYDDIYLPK